MLTDAAICGNSSTGAGEMQNQLARPVSKLWYYADPNSSGQIGPLTLERLQSILANLPHASDAFVWCEGMPEWKRVGEILDFRAPLTAPPPLPKAFENEQMPTWRVRWWWLVFALGAPVISSRDGRRMMAWTSGQRRRTRAIKRASR
jgi:GYF domain 2